MKHLTQYLAYNYYALGGTQQMLLDRQLGKNFAGVSA